MLLIGLIEDGEVLQPVHRPRRDASAGRERDPASVKDDGCETVELECFAEFVILECEEGLVGGKDEGVEREWQCSSVGVEHPVREEELDGVVVALALLHLG